MEETKQGRGQEKRERKREINRQIYVYVLKEEGREALKKVMPQEQESEREEGKEQVQKGKNMAKKTKADQADNPNNIRLYLLFCIL